MRRMIFALALIAIIIAFFAVGASAQEKKAEPAKVTPDKTAQTKGAPPKVPAGKVVVDEEILIGFVDEPSRHFGLARDDFLKKDFAASADEIRKGAGYVKLEMSRAASGAEDERALSDAVAQLAKLADDIEKGAVTSVDRLNAGFAKAEQALAFHHELKAKEYWAAEEQKKAGQDLKAASKHLENAMKYANEKVETGTEAAIQDARDIGQKLVEGTGWAADKVGKAMQDLGKKIEDAGKKMMAPKK
jgi:hypothetical protein